MNRLKKSVVFITHYNSMNGANQSLLTLLQYLKNDDQISIANVFVHNPSREQDGLVAQLRNVSIPFSNVNLHSCLYFKSNLLSFLALPFRLLRSVPSLFLMWRYILKNQVDVIYSNSSVETYGVLLAKVLKKRHIWHIREYGFKDYKLRHIFGKRFKRLVFNLSDVLIVISKSIQDYVSLQQKVRLVYNGIVSLSSLGDFTNFPNNTLLERSAPRLSIIGVISETKNQKRAIDALSQLIQEGYNINLQIWGQVFDKNYKSTLDEIIEERLLHRNVQFRGFVSNQNVIYGETDVLLMCSKNEAFGRVTVEAMSYGIPVIGYNAGGTAEIIQSGENGLLYDDENISLETQIKVLLTDSILFNQIRRGALKSVTSYSIENYARIISDIIQSN